MELQSHSSNSAFWNILCGERLFFCLFVCFVLFCFVFSSQGFSVEPWLSWNSLCRPGWPRSLSTSCSDKRIMFIETHREFVSHIQHLSMMWMTKANQIEKLTLTLKTGSVSQVSTLTFTLLPCRNYNTWASLTVVSETLWLHLVLSEALLSCRAGPQRPPGKPDESREQSSHLQLKVTSASICPSSFFPFKPVHLIFHRSVDCASLGLNLLFSCRAGKEQKFSFWALRPSMVESSFNPITREVDFWVQGQLGLHICSRSARTLERDSASKNQNQTKPKPQQTNKQTIFFRYQRIQVPNMHAHVSGSSSPTSLNAPILEAKHVLPWLVLGC
jgi:hypothetical protein